MSDTPDADASEPADATDHDAPDHDVDAPDHDVDGIAVVGAGRMGHGIALTYALAGHPVRLFDVDEETLASSPDRIADALDTFTERGRYSESAATDALDRISLHTDVAEAVDGVDFVTEAVAEDAAIKQAVFEDLDEHAPADAILATNTSGISIDEIAGPVEDASRVLGTHWFNPPHLVPLVEVVKGSATTDAAAQRIRALLEDADKTPIVVQKDVPGFIGNRIQAAMSYEAFSLLARGVATPQDIDRAVKAGFGFRLPIMGIFEKMDQSGLAIHHEVEKRLMGDLDRGTDPNPVIEELLEEGYTGTETGKGIYDWTDVDLESVRERRDGALLDMLDLYEESDAESSPPAYYDRT
ncbi:3-hydroxyacyl-CoA dehydrogenase [Salinarchaeum sp. Harcht-Bsk1]|uniref:3-hydroxyacyl-CoA dehydrogenase family protein n=1 Tax=Salinarchaeum sp. Harcht-Bsk1 TaxID=1333523 RepID=UPI000342349B|nr:3-hydroxyacyl-CoA dehydrogenase family protein [Salinarchaeum sp. Harcht-Bsk1]AGN01239.1 3-hydroxyacyl-CoA dehydrogenase [Salinarchaeum sp. Harcht-Bsk1]